MPAVQTLHADWEFSESGKENWHPAVVPGHVHLDLARNGIIPNPYKNAYELGCQWVDRADWTYRTTFTYQSNSKYPVTCLIFEGLDTIAEVWLNGELLAESDNMFIPLELNIEDSILEGENHLEIRFKSAVVEGEKRRKDYFLAQKISDQTAAFEERSFIRKAPYMSGWDWGPRLVSCGIWKPVKLVQLAQNELYFPYGEPSEPIAEFRREDDTYGQSFSFFLNNKKLLVRGANWIPDTSFPSELDPDRLTQSLDQYQANGINMLRVWGGGIYESDLFYELCAERNILVWQDFLFACSYYPENEEFLKSVEIEAREAILRLRKHPNLVLWCGNNECHTMWDSPWHGPETRPDHFYARIIYEELLPKLVKELDPGRPYIPSSPIGGAKANDAGIGDNHFWDVWHGRGDWRFYEDSKSRFCSEFGFASAPCEKTWRECLGTIDLKPGDPLVRQHDKTLKPWDTFRSMVELHYPPSDTLLDWIYHSQLNQRDAMRAAIEHFRSQDFCDGTLIWQANDCWPVQSWSLFDHALRPKAAAYELKRLYNDLLICVRREKEALIVTLANDSPFEAEGDIRVTGTHIQSGEVLCSERFRATVQTGTRQIVGKFNLTGLNTSETCIEIKFGPHSRHVFLTEPKLIRLAETAPILAKVTDNRIELVTAQPLFDLMLTHDGDPSLFKQNFLTVPVPGRVSIPVEGRPKNMAARSLSGRHRIDWV